MATAASTDTRDQSFWQKMALGLALFIVFGFGQFTARGMVAIDAMPIHAHVHGLVMLAWLALTVAQPVLARRGDVALHRRLGWLGLGMAALVVAVCSYAGIAAVQAQRQPPFFSPPYFLALTQVGIIVFAGLVTAAVLLRRDTQWHRRLMLGSTIHILEPALGRLLPMPFLFGQGEWLVLACQLAVLALVARHDRRTLGVIHPATLAVGAAITLSHIVIETLAVTPAFITFTGQVAGS